MCNSAISWYAERQFSRFGPLKRFAAPLPCGHTLCRRHLNPGTSLPLRSIFRRLVTQWLHASGLLWLLLKWRTRRRLLVLTYHRVLPDEARAESFSADGIVVTPGTFDRQMRLLARRFQVLTPDDFFAVLAGHRPWPTRGCLVTFDDGWWDNLEYAAPVLSRHGIPALLFVATDFIGSSSVFWQERLSNMLMQVRTCGEPARVFLQQLDAAHLLAVDKAGLRLAIRGVIDQFKRRPPADLQQALLATENFLAHKGVTPRAAAADRFLSWQQLAQLLGESPFLVGSHGCSHVPFTHLTAEELEAQLRLSRDRIAQETGAAVKDLAYPNGDCDGNVAQSTGAAGYRMAFSTERGYVASSDNRHRLRRINIHEHGSSTDAMFLARLAGLT